VFGGRQNLEQQIASGQFAVRFEQYRNGTGFGVLAQFKQTLADELQCLLMRLVGGQLVGEDPHKRATKLLSQVDIPPGFV
jgi:hypothetical protein